LNDPQKTIRGDAYIVYRLFIGVLKQKLRN
jgi:hypothetical protein